MKKFTKPSLKSKSRRGVNARLLANCYQFLFRHVHRDKSLFSQVGKLCR